MRKVSRPQSLIRFNSERNSSTCAVSTPSSGMELEGLRVVAGWRPEMWPITVPDGIDESIVDFDVIVIKSSIGRPRDRSTSGSFLSTNQRRKTTVENAWTTSSKLIYPCRSSRDNHWFALQTCYFPQNARVLYSTYVWTKWKRETVNQPVSPWRKLLSTLSEAKSETDLCVCMVSSCSKHQSSSSSVAIACVNDVSSRN